MIYGDKIKSIVENIDNLRKQLRDEYDSMQQTYGYFITKKKVVFEEKMKVLQISKKVNLFRYMISASFRNVLSAPFIYSMIIPGIILDVFLTMYQFTAFPLYRIPRVLRKDYFIYDRRFLKYLNLLEKLNCLYCSYMNGLFAYAVEIAGRTEQYWCPIKHAIGSEGEHRYYSDFTDYGNGGQWDELRYKEFCFRGADPTKK